MSMKDWSCDRIMKISISTLTEGSLYSEQPPISGAKGHSLRFGEAIKMKQKNFYEFYRLNFVQR